MTAVAPFGSPRDTRGCVVEEAAQRVGAVVVGVRDRRCVDRRHDRHVDPRPAEDDVQPLLAALLVDRPEVHHHAPVPVRPVAHAHQDDVALVTLDVLEVLDEQPDDLVVVLADQLRLVQGRERLVRVGERLELALDLGLLRLGERDDPDRQTRLAPQQLADELGDVRRFARIRALHVRRAVDPMEADGPRQQGVDAGRALVLIERRDVRAVDPDLRQRLRAGTAVGDGGQSPVVERRVAEVDERLVAAPVVPGQHRRGQPPRRLGKEAVAVEDDAHLDLVVLVVGKRRGWR